MNIRRTRQSGFSTVEVLVVIVVLLLVGLGSLVVVRARQHTTTPVVASVRSTTDSWTGKGTTQNWSEAANWSNGVPKAGDDLVFDISAVHKPASGLAAQLKNDLAGRSFHNITFQGKGAVSFMLTGSPLKLTGSIVDQVITTGTSDAMSAAVYVTINNDLTFTGTGGVTLDDGSSLSLGSTNSTITLAGSSFNLTDNGSGNLSVLAPLSGKSAVSLSASDGLLSIASSPHLSGTVDFTHGTISSAADTFGSSALTIHNGAAWSITGTHTSSVTVGNPITLAGIGLSKGGVTTGAIWACITDAEQGCGTNEAVTFTAPITLSADAQIGTSGDQGTVPTHVDYTYATVNRNGHVLTTVTDYQSSNNF